MHGNSNIKFAIDCPIIRQKQDTRNREAQHVLTCLLTSFGTTSLKKLRSPPAIILCQLLGHASRFQCLRCQRRGSAAAHLLGFWVRIPPGAWMSVCWECCVLTGRGLCIWLIIRPEESYRECVVMECDCEASIMRRAWPTTDSNLSCICACTP